MMRSTLTDRGQTTIPSGVRKALKLKPRERLTYEVRGESVVIRREGETLLDLYGCLGDGQPPLTQEQEREAIAESVMEQNPLPGGLSA